MTICLEADVDGDAISRSIGHTPQTKGMDEDEDLSFFMPHAGPAANE